jgi:hypothetical protein
MTLQTNINSEEKKRILNDSPLWNSLLTDKEIRYSDFLGLFIETYKQNPFEHGQIGYDIEVNREKKHTDLWIEKIIDISNDEGNGIRDTDNNSQEEIGVFKLPVILVENKLKSIPFRDQIKIYTEKFIDEYIYQVKQIFKSKHSEFQPSEKGKKGKQITLPAIREKNDEEVIKLLNEIQNLKFYLISPFKTQGLDSTFKFTRKIIPNNKGVLEYTWKQITYDEIGNNILNILDKDEHKEIKKYLKELFQDFAEILNSMTLFNSALMDIDFTAEIKDFFAPKKKEGFKDFKNMHSLYKKVKASQCAQKLSELSKCEVNRKPALKMVKEEICCHYDFSRNDSLFEVKKCIVKGELIIIIQYQNEELRKGLVVSDIAISKYNSWFDQEWNGIKFLPKPNGGHYSYRINDKMTFFYYKHKCENESVETILNLMAEKIQDNTEVKDLTTYYNAATK